MIEGHWESYFTRVNNQLASIFVDLARQANAPDPGRPVLLHLWVNFLNPRQDGLSDSEEAPALFELEDAIDDAVRGRCGAVYVGRITGSGRREFYFYGPNEDEYESAVNAVMSRYPSYEYEWGTHRDPEWKQYLELLYPTSVDFLQIKNRHVIDELMKHGDTLEKTRNVSHWAYFRAPDARSVFADRAEGLGYKVREYEVEEGDQPYAVVLNREDHVDWNSINNITLELFRLAEEFSGWYDGWETSVEQGT